MTFETPTRYRIRAREQYRTSRWKNGQGETRHIIQAHINQNTSYRISQATIHHNGQFSDFSGQQRTLVLLKGMGVSLKHKTQRGYDVVHELKSPLSVARFNGGDETSATLLDGSVEVLNIMASEGQLASYVEIVTPSMSVFALRQPQSNYACFYANEGCDVLIRSCLVNDGSDNVTKVSVGSRQTLEFNEAVEMKLIKGCGVFVQFSTEQLPSYGKYRRYL